MNIRFPVERTIHRMMRRAGWPCLFSLAFLLSGCHRDHIQSAVHPAGPASERIAALWWFMFIVLGIIFLIVLVLTWAAVVRRPRGTDGSSALGTRFVVISGIVLPSVILVVLLFMSVRASVALKTPETRYRVQVIGHQWWWEVRYPDQQITTANEIYIPAHEPVLLELSSADVIHSFWVPNLSGKMDMLPGHTNRLSIHARRPGIFRGQCAEFCGLQHALMAFEVIVLPTHEYELWLAEKQGPVPEPDTPLRLRGREVYYAAACHNCHAIRGAEAEGVIGPDLTHIGSRLSLGAGILRNNRGNLAGWIINPQPLKPGNRMPPSYLDPDDLHALVDYLESLK
jgi:cytochrome c oxidase subunit II